MTPQPPATPSLADLITAAENAENAVTAQAGAVANDQANAAAIQTKLDTANQQTAADQAQLADLLNQDIAALQSLDKGIQARVTALQFLLPPPPAPATK